MNITSKLWWKAAAIRALRTFAQAAISLIPAAVTIQSVDWITVLSTAALAAVISLLTSLGGLPEVDLEESVKTAQNEKNNPPEVQTEPEIRVVYLDSEDEYTQTGEGRIYFLNNEEKQEPDSKDGEGE